MAIAPKAFATGHCVHLLSTCQLLETSFPLNAVVSSLPLKVSSLPLEANPARTTRSAPAAVVLEGQGPIKLVFAYPLKPSPARGTTSAPAAFVLEGQNPIQLVFANPSFPLEALEPFAARATRSVPAAVVKKMGSVNLGHSSPALLT